MNSLDRLFYASEINQEVDRVKSAFASGVGNFALDMLPGIGTYRQGHRAFNDFSEGNIWGGIGNTLGAAGTLVGAGFLGKGIGKGVGMIGKGLGMLGKGTSWASKAAPVWSKAPGLSALAKGTGNLAGKAMQGIGEGAANAVPGASSWGAKNLPFLNKGIEGTRFGNTGAGKLLSNNQGKINLGAGTASYIAGRNGGGMEEQANNYSNAIQNLRNIPQQNENPLWQSPNPSPMWEQATRYLSPGTMFGNN